MADSLSLESLDVGAQPLLRPLVERLRLRELFTEALGPLDSRLAISPVDMALVLVRNFALSRHPLYGVSNWARRFDPAQLDLTPGQLRLVNDDRLGRTLDRFFAADLRSLATRIVAHLITEFDVDLDVAHNDSTSITFSGQYARGDASRKRRLRITHGHNKDHRPDLKQLVWTLTVSGDGAVPVHYNIYDGNITDDRTHIATWEALRRLRGSTRFCYVADCKLCTREQMAHIAGLGGRFLTILPGTRREDREFREALALAPVAWQTIWKRPPQRRRHDPPELFEAFEPTEPSSDGYRIVWFRSSEKHRRDAEVRANAIDRARAELGRLREQVGARRLKTREQIAKAVDKVLDRCGARSFLLVELREEPQHTFKQSRRGRPGKTTTYVRQTTVRYEPVVSLDLDRVRAAAAADGIFPLITNAPAAEMTALQMLQTYKYQSFLEKRHEQLKTVLDVMPVNFKSVERIESFLFFYFLSLLIHSLIERQVRNAMRARNIKAIPLYPEERACRAPTADKLLALFEPLRVNRLFDNERLLRTFHDALTDIHRTVLDLLDVPAGSFVAHP